MGLSSREERHVARGRWCLCLENLQTLDQERAWRHTMISVQSVSWFCEWPSRDSFVMAVENFCAIKAWFTVRRQSGLAKCTGRLVITRKGLPGARRAAVAREGRVRLQPEQLLSALFGFKTMAWAHRNSPGIGDSTSPSCAPAPGNDVPRSCTSRKTWLSKTPGVESNGERSMAGSISSCAAIEWLASSAITSSGWKPASAMRARIFTDGCERVTFPVHHLAYHGDWVERVRDSAVGRGRRCVRAAHKGLDEGSARAQREGDRRAELDHVSEGDAVRECERLQVVHNLVDTGVGGEGELSVPCGRLMVSASTSYNGQTAYRMQ